MIYAGGLTVAATGSYLTRLENAELAKASLYFEEGWEATRSIARNDWAALSNGSHGLNASGGFWGFEGSSDNYDGLTRTIIVSDIRRDEAGNIAPTGGEIDSDSKKILVEVTWSPVPGKDLSLSAVSYLTNYRDAGEWPPVPEAPPEP